eukprot:m.29251 g.29251  ORF g.29251 m.29251 type:complete len:100 (+) comp6134_c0_seq3:57-356(+)
MKETVYVTSAGLGICVIVSFFFLSSRVHPDTECRKCFLNPDNCEEFCVQKGMSGLGAFSFFEVLNLVAAAFGIIAVRKRYRFLQRQFEAKLEQRVYQNV